MQVRYFGIVVFALVIAMCSAARTESHNHGGDLMVPRGIPGGMMMPGGIGPANIHSPGFRRVDAYVRRHRPELRTARVVSARSQVVAGTKWYINYQTRLGLKEVEVVDQPWTNTIRIVRVGRPLRRTVW